MKQDRADLLIIGGGVLGTFHAWHALKSGLSVILLERHSAPRGATVRNFGQVVPSGMDRKWQGYGRESLEIYKSIQQQFDISVRQAGSIYLASDDEELQLLEELHDINRDEGYSSELWTPSRCSTRYPQLRISDCCGGLFFPEEVSVNPRVMIHRLHLLLREQAGFRSSFQTCVAELSAQSGGVTAFTTDGRRFAARRAILCCGSEFQTLFPDLFRDSDLQGVGLQMLRLKPQPEVSLPGNILTGLSIRRYESFSQCPSWRDIKSKGAGGQLRSEMGYSHPVETGI